MFRYRLLLNQVANIIQDGVLLTFLKGRSIEQMVDVTGNCNFEQIDEIE